MNVDGVNQIDNCINQNDILSAFEKVMPYLPSLFDDEVSIALTDRTSFINNITCRTLPLKSEPGDPIQEGGAGAKAIQSGEVIVKEVSSEVYGVPFKSYAVPLKNETGEVVGSILVARNLERSKKVMRIAKDLATVFGQINKAVNELSEDIQKLAEMNQNISEKSDKAVEHAVRTDEVLSFIKKIAAQTNLLGLNAGIEAARVGAAGRGFEVVANEIRKMSVNTAVSADKVGEVLSSIEESINIISGDIKEANGIFQEQIAAIEEITASMSEIYGTVKVLEELSEQL